MANIVRRRVLVSGRVQGVWFRQSCVEEAARLGATGWVRNRADGAVEAVFEGPATVVDSMVRWCWDGPPRAQVESVATTDEPPAGLADFRVRP